MYMGCVCIYFVYGGESIKYAFSLKITIQVETSTIVA